MRRRRAGLRWCGSFACRGAILAGLRAARSPTWFAENFARPSPQPHLQRNGAQRALRPQRLQGRQLPAPSNPCRPRYLHQFRPGPGPGPCAAPAAHPWWVRGSPASSPRERSRSPPLLRVLPAQSPGIHHGASAASRYPSNPYTRATSASSSLSFTPSARSDSRTASRRACVTRRFAPAHCCGVRPRLGAIVSYPSPSIT